MEYKTGTYETYNRGEHQACFYLHHHMQLNKNDDGVQLFGKACGTAGDPGAWLIAEKFSSVGFPTVCHEIKGALLAFH